MGEPLSVYMAASRDCAGRADSLAKELTRAGVRIVSRWHDGQIRLVDPHDPAVRQQILRDNLSDLDAAGVVVALMDDGKPRATYAEIGYALAEGKMVLWLTRTPCESDSIACIFDAHRSVVRVASEEGLIEIVGTLQMFEWEPTRRRSRCGCSA